MKSAKGGLGRPSLFCAPLLACALASGCAGRAPKTAPAAASSERDGSSVERAIPILESTEAAGVAAERAWILEHYPGARKLMGGIQADDGRHFDVVKLRLADGSEKTLYFDITAFFGF